MRLFEVGRVFHPTAGRLPGRAATRRDRLDRSGPPGTLVRADPIAVGWFDLVPVSSTVDRRRRRAHCRARPRGRAPRALSAHWRVAARTGRLGRGAASRTPATFRRPGVGRRDRPRQPARWRRLRGDVLPAAQSRRGGTRHRGGPSSRRPLLARGPGRAARRKGARARAPSMPSTATMGKPLEPGSAAVTVRIRLQPGQNQPDGGDDRELPAAAWISGPLGRKSGVVPRNPKAADAASTDRLQSSSHEEHSTFRRSGCRGRLSGFGNSRKKRKDSNRSWKLLRRELAARPAGDDVGEAWMAERSEMVRAIEETLGRASSRVGSREGKHACRSIQNLQGEATAVTIFGRTYHLARRRRPATPDRAGVHRGRQDA